MTDGGDGGDVAGLVLLNVGNGVESGLSAIGQQSAKADMALMTRVAVSPMPRAIETSDFSEALNDAKRLVVGSGWDVNASKPPI